MAAGSLPILFVINKTDISGPDFEPGPVMELSREYGIPFRLASARTGYGVPGSFADLASRPVRPRAAIGARNWRPRPQRTMRRPAGRFDRWEFSAVFWPGDPGPAGWPDPLGSCVV